MSRVVVSCDCPSCRGQSATVNRSAMMGHEPGTIGWRQYAHSYVGLVDVSRVQNDLELRIIRKVDARLGAES